MVSGTVLSLGRGGKWRQGLGFSGYALSGVPFDGFVYVIRKPHGDHLLAGFVGLQQAEARLTRIEILLNSSLLLHIE